MKTAGYTLGLATLALVGAAQAAPITLNAISDYKGNMNWQDIKGTSYTFADANNNGQVDVGEAVTFTVDMEKQWWGRHSFDALKIWIDGTPINPPSTTLTTQNFEWDFSTSTSRGNSAYDSKAWTDGDKLFNFTYTFATAGTFDLTASVMCSADLSTLVSDGAFDAPTTADWNAWNENMHQWNSNLQGETERYQLKVFAAVPEPGTLALFSFGIFGLAAMVYSKKKKLA